MDWLSGWSHRKTVTITGQTGAGTNYQVNLSIGDASGGDFHLENHCTSFPNDITVTDNNQISLLDHWVEDLTVDPISMWVEIADDLGSNVDVCVYYGKSGESSASNGPNTFSAEFDDFEGASVDSGKWDVEITDVTTSTDYAFQGSKSAKIGNSGRLKKTLIHSDNIAIKFWTYFPSQPDMFYPLLHGDSTSRMYVIVGEPSAGDISYYDSSWHDTGVNTITGAWKSFEAKNFVWASHTQDILYNEVEIASDIGQRSGNDYEDIFAFHSSGQYYYVDCFLVRKFLSPTEPAFSSAGSEESAGGRLVFVTLLKEQILNMALSQEYPLNVTISQGVLS